MITTPGHTFADELITKALVNAAGQMTFAIEANEVTSREIEDSLVAPQIETLTPASGVATWTMVADRSDQFGEIVLDQNTVLTLAGLVAGMHGFLTVWQDGTGSRTLTLSPTPIVGNAGAGTIGLTATANAIDIILWEYDGTTLSVRVANDFK